MNILIINCHSNNRGDEAAVRSMVEELNILYPESKFILAVRGDKYPNFPKNVEFIQMYHPLSFKRMLEYKLIKFTRGKLCLSKISKNYLKSIFWADIILHAPGGPSIGDIYLKDEKGYLRGLDILITLKKKYIFYAPSMGPFNQKKNFFLRKKILSNASAIILRDPISKKYVNEFMPNLNVYQTLDSAFQYDFKTDRYATILMENKNLFSFISNKKVIGITITDLKWHPKYSANSYISENIKNVFDEFLLKYEGLGYKFIFIPQLYGSANDEFLMKYYKKNDVNYYILSSNNTNYDTFFQQFLISKLYAVIGMRYHSNIFSAKEGTPFISISYEQKMFGFMQKIGLEEYCIDINELSIIKLENKFKKLNSNYELYNQKLKLIHNFLLEESRKTSLITKRIIEDGR